MKQKHNYTDYDKWFDEYKPVINHIDKNASYDGCMFETYGKEEKYIRNFPDQHKVWTIVSDDYGFLCVIAGWHYVNRMGYMITEKPWEDEDDFNIYDSDDIKKILRRERYMTSKQK